MLHFRSMMKRKRRYRYFLYCFLLLGSVGYGIVHIWNNKDSDAGNVPHINRHLLQYQADNFTSNSPSVHHRHKNHTCQDPSIAQFPGDVFTQAQRLHGAIVVHAVVAIYMLIGITIICDYHFIPTLALLCYKLKIQQDVAGALLMAIGSSAPDLFAAMVGIFLTKGDIGIGTILGTSVLNLLFVIGLCGIVAELQLNYWPITRDAIAFALSIVAITFVLLDSVVKLEEAIVLILLYVLYVVYMTMNERIEKAFYSFFGMNETYKIRFEKTIYNTVPISNGGKQNKKDDDGKYGNVKYEPIELNQVGKPSDMSAEKDDGWVDEGPENILECPDSPWGKFWWVVNFPLKLAFLFTVPDLRRPWCHRLIFITFFMSISWMVILCYILVWMITVIGYTIDIPDSIMGLTFICFGSSVPDVIASVIVAGQGQGDMAVSQALGSNTFGILLGLGVPWTIKSFINDSTIYIESLGMIISCLITFAVNMLVLLVLYLVKFNLGKKLGIGLLLLYFVYLAAFIGMEVVFYKQFRVPMCDLGKYYTYLKK